MATKSKKKNGRPSIYTDKLVLTICKRLSKGESLRSICRDDAMPHIDTVYGWLLDGKHERFSAQYTHARQIQAELMFEELEELCDVSPQDIVGDDKSDNARVQARKLQVDTRKWILAKMMPKKYGEKLDLTSDGKQLPVNIVSFRDTKK